MNSILDYNHHLLRPFLIPGGIAVDATAGNGHDTCFLAESLGPEGTVYAFDIQQAALEAARKTVEETPARARVHFIHAGHEDLTDHIPAAAHGRICACMFNLGYLPGGDRQIITRPESTLAALGQALEILMPGGCLSVVRYSGHSGGGEESAAVQARAAELDQAAFSALECCFINQRGRPPSLLLITKKG